MGESIAAIFNLDSDWLHQSLTQTGAVTGNFLVHMFAPKAIGAVVGITGTDSFCPANLANKIFFLADKIHNDECTMYNVKLQGGL